MRRLSTVWVLAVGAVGLAVLAQRLPAAPVGDPAARTVQAVTESKLGELAKSLQTELLAAVADPKTLDRSAVVELAACASLAGALGDGKDLSPLERRTLTWLLGQPALRSMLGLALAEQDKPRDVLAVLAALVDKREAALPALPELVTALCVVWDCGAAVGADAEFALETTTRPASAATRPVPASRKEGPNPAWAAELFGYFTANRRQMRTDLAVTPWQIQAYMVNLQVDARERAWALDRYGRSRDVASSYFDVPYDKAGLYFGRWQGIKGQPYTLPNLLKHGGVCKDQAYFAAQVCKANGLPAAFCTGQSGRGEGFHAWLGFLRVSPRQVAFDFNTARYPEHEYWAAHIQDPQTQEKLSDADVALLAETYRTRAEDRLLSAALARAAELAAGEAKVDLYQQAIRLSPGHRRAWVALARACGDGEAGVQRRAQVMASLQRFAVGRYDEFAVDQILRLIAGQPPQEQHAALGRAAGLFARRPDLLSRIRLAQADLLRELKREAEAMAQYRQILKDSLKNGPAVLEVLERMEDLTADTGEWEPLAEVIRGVWPRMKEPEPSGYAWTTPWFIIGQRYAAVLEKAGKDAQARQVRATVEGKDTSRKKPA